MTASAGPPVEVDPVRTQASRATRTSAARARRLAFTGIVVVLLVVEAAVVSPEIRRVLTSLWRLEVGWVGVGVLCAAMSMSMFARVRRRLLHSAGYPVPVRSAVAAVYVANSLHATLPGGVAFSTGYTYRWMRGHGVGGPVAAWCLVASGLVSTAALLAFGAMGSLLAGGQAGWAQLALAVTGIVLVTAVIRHLAQDPRVVVTVARWVLGLVNRVRRRPAAMGVDGLNELLVQLRSVRPGGRDWLVATGYALLNWAFDAACLAACAAALDLRGLTLPLLLIAYTAGMATAGLSPLPGGLGLVDATLVVAFVAGGIPAAAALPVVMLYRLISLVGVVAAGWVVCAIQQLRHPASPTTARI